MKLLGAHRGGGIDRENRAAGAGWHGMGGYGDRGATSVR
jgi:hypothetical protein